jgi:hypothetical protein
MDDSVERGLCSGFGGIKIQRFFFASRNDLTLASKRRGMNESTILDDDSSHSACYIQ